MKDGDKQYSKLMWACNLNPNFDAGHFCYHLSQLIKGRIVSKANGKYGLTQLGLKLSNFLDSVETEFTLSFTEEKERKGGVRMFEVKRLEESDLKRLVLKKYGVLKEEAEGHVQDYVESERFWVYGQKDPFESGENRTLIALDKGRIAGAIYGSKSGEIPIPKGTKGLDVASKGLMYLHKLTEEERRREISAATIYDIWVEPTYHERGIEETLIEAFIEQMSGEKSRKVTASEIASSREDLLKALKKAGFRRVDAHYKLEKRIAR